MVLTVIRFNKSPDERPLLLLRIDLTPVRPVLIASLEGRIILLRIDLTTVRPVLMALLEGSCR